MNTTPTTESKQLELFVIGILAEIEAKLNIEVPKDLDLNSYEGKAFINGVIYKELLKKVDANPKQYIDFLDVNYSVIREI